MQIDLADARRQADESWDGVASTSREMAHRLWTTPELGLMEHSSAGILRDWLIHEGFTVRESASACSTAFVAEKGNSTGPTIGILVEYDALPALSNVAEPRRAALNGPDFPGHGCGHNLIGAVNTGAGIAVANVLSDLGLDGRVILFGTPAEEILFGKVAMLEAGDFEGVDILLSHHPGYETGALSRPTQALVSGEIGFVGTTAHTGVPVSHNSQDAVELSIAMVERLRSHNFAGVSIEHTVRLPRTSMPSNSPEEMRCWWSIRDVDYAKVEACYRWILDISRVAARLCRVDVSDTVLTACRGYLPNDVIAELLYEELLTIGSPQWIESDLTRMAEFGVAFDSSSTFELHRGVELLRSDYDRYAQDDGEVSHFVPLGRYTWAFPRNVPFHSWASTAYFGTDLAWRSADPVGRALTRSAVRIAASPELINTATAELRRRVPAPFVRSLSGEWDRLPAQAAAFWRGDWDWRNQEE